MAREAFDAIREGLEDAIAHGRGDRDGRRTTRCEMAPVAAIRRRTGLSQADFARAFGISIETLRKWEQGQRQPTGPARQLLRLIEHDPKGVLAALDAA